MDARNSNSPIVGAFLDKTPASARLGERGRKVFPTGLTHDSRYLEPHQVYIDRAEGAHKWDVDGNRYIDYFGGHGALLLGHNRPEVLGAVHSALDKGTHFGAGHELEVEWGEAVARLVPSAERVRFVSSGTEATHMAVRLARAHTGRRKLIRFRTHFHGWHDHMTSGFASHFDGTPTPGVLTEITENVVLLDPGDSEALEAALGAGDVAAVILEPSGGSFGMTPLDRRFLESVRAVTKDYGALLIFDEVITGFRVAPGGAQEWSKVTPDLTTLAKILAGGLPGGAVVGRQDVVDLLDFDEGRRGGRAKVQHQGTFNANPVSAAAGVTTLDIVERTDACERATAAATNLRQRLNQVLADQEIGWAVYGGSSGFHVFMNPHGRRLDPVEFDPGGLGYEELKTKPGTLVNKLRLAMVINGVDIGGWPGGFVSAAHTDQDIDETVSAFAAAVDCLRREEELPQAG